jgi:hypothetical protein
LLPSVQVFVASLLDKTSHELRPKLDRLEAWV